MAQVIESFQECRYGPLETPENESIDSHFSKTDPDLKVKDECKIMDYDYFVIKSLMIKTRNGSKDFGFSIRQDTCSTDVQYYVDYVDPGGSAAHSGLAVGDVLIELNRESIKKRTYLSLKFAIKQASYTGRLDVKICRTPFAKFINEGRSNHSTSYSSSDNSCTRTSPDAIVKINHKGGEEANQLLPQSNTQHPTDLGKAPSKKRSVLCKAQIYEDYRRKEKMEDAQKAFLEWKTRRKNKLFAAANYNNDTSLYDTTSSNSSSSFNLYDESAATAAQDQLLLLKRQNNDDQPPYMDYRDTLTLKSCANFLKAETVATYGRAGGPLGSRDVTKEAGECSSLEKCAERPLGDGRMNEVWGEVRRDVSVAGKKYVRNRSKSYSKQPTTVAHDTKLSTSPTKRLSLPLYSDNCPSDVPSPDNDDDDALMSKDSILCAVTKDRINRSEQNYSGMRDKISDSSDSGLSGIMSDTNDTSSVLNSCDNSSSPISFHSERYAINYENSVKTSTPRCARKDCGISDMAPAAIDSVEDESGIACGGGTRDQTDVPVFKFPKIRDIIPSFSGYKSNLPSLFQLEQKELRSKNRVERDCKIRSNDISPSVTPLEKKLKVLLSTSIKECHNINNEISKIDAGSGVKDHEGAQGNDERLDPDADLNNEGGRLHDKCQVVDVTLPTLKLISMTLTCTDDETAVDDCEGEQEQEKIIEKDFDKDGLEVDGREALVNNQVLVDRVDSSAEGSGDNFRDRGESDLESNEDRVVSMRNNSKRLIHPIKLIKFGSSTKDVGKCRSCGNDIKGDKALIRVKDLDHNYHLNCFKCAICNYSAGNRFKNILSSTYSDDLEIDLPPVKIHNNNIINCINCD